MENKLSLPENFFLLSIHPEKGGQLNGAGLSNEYCIIAAYMMDLKNNGRIEINNGYIKINSFSTSGRIESYILSKFKKFDRPLKTSRWFKRLYSSIGHIKRELKKEMGNKQLIRLEDKKFLFFKWKKAHLSARTTVRELVKKAENIIYSGEVPDDEKELISLIEPSGLLKRIFPDRHKRKNARRKLKQMNVDNEISIALKKAIAATRAAMAS